MSEHEKPPHHWRLEFRAGFDPIRLSWGAPDEPVSEACAICDTPFGDDDVPLMMWRGDGWCVRLCGACVERWIVVR